MSVERYKFKTIPIVVFCCLFITFRNYRTFKETWEQDDLKHKCRELCSVLAEDLKKESLMASIFADNPNVVMMKLHFNIYH